VQIAVTFVLAMIGWVFFRSPGMQSAGTHLAAMFGWTSKSDFPYYLDVNLLHWIVLGIAAVRRRRRR